MWMFMEILTIYFEDFESVHSINTFLNTMTNKPAEIVLLSFSLVINNDCRPSRWSHDVKPFIFRFLQVGSWMRYFWGVYFIYIYFFISKIS